jgi:cobalt-zinc-cadmium efflux system membrane fusion protein
MNKIILIGIIVCGLIAGCHKHDHEHGEPKTAQITVWTNGYEIFVEHQAPVVNEPMQFVTHVTDLQTFEPRREGPVTFVMQQAGQRMVHAEAKPARDGIYLPKLKFPKEGDWELSVVIPSGGTNPTISLGKIEVHGDPHDAAHAEFPEPPEDISFLKEQQWKLPMATELAGKRTLVERVRVPGQTRAKPGFSADVVSPVPGQIAAGERVIVPGERVEAGQVLALVQPRLTEATARLAEAEGAYTRTRAELANAEAMLARIQRLHAVAATTEVELEEAELGVKRAQANFEAATALRSMYRQNIHLASATSGPPRIEVRAPIGGIVDRAAAGLGQAVADGERLFTIINLEALWIEANVPEALAQKISDAGEAAYERAGRPGELIEGGTRVYTGLAIDRETRSVPVIYEIGNGPRIGEAVNLYVRTQRAEEAIAIPEAAIVEEAGQPIAFVQLSGETFDKRTLKLGIRDGRFVQVLEGISEGERVVTQGAFAIRLATVSGVIPAHGHAH